MPMTLDDLIEAVRRLADSNFATAAAINKLVPAFEQLRHDVYDIKNDRELDQAKIDLAVGQLNTHLALLLDNVKSAQGDVKALSKEVTGTHLLAPARDERTAAERIFDKLESARTSTKILVAILLLVCAGGGLLHLLIAALTGG